MRVGDIMDTNVAAADARTPAATAWTQMQDQDIRTFVVSDRSGIIGLVTREQLGGAGGDLNRCGRVLGDFVRRGRVVTTPESPVGSAARLFGPHVDGCVPVLDRGRLVGVLTVSHLLQIIARMERLLRRSSRRTNVTAPRRVEAEAPPHA